MSPNTSDPTRGAQASPRKNPLAAVFLVLGLLAASIGAYAVAGADTTVTPSGPGAVGADQLVRDDSVHISVSHDGTYPDSPSIFSRSYTTAPAYPANAASYAVTNFAAPSSPGARLLQDNLFWIPQVNTCRGDAKTPMTRVTVTAPDGTTESFNSAPRTGIDSLGSLAGDYPRSATNPPIDPTNTTNFRGEVPKNIGTAGVVRGMAADYSLVGKPAGVYTVVTEERDAYRTAAGFGSSRPASCVAGDFRTTKTQTFEYRPWQHVFEDVGGAGKVSFNLTPVAESQQRVAAQTGAIIPGHMTFYRVPGLGSFALPSDPTGCATDPASCLPAGALACDPAAGCEPRLVVIARSQPSETLHGIFDLETGAFISSNRVGDTARIMFSLGDDLDEYYSSIIPKLRELAASLGMDIEDLLGLGISLSGGPGGREGTLTLLNGLQIDPATRKGGLNLLLNDVGLQAGLMLHIYANLVPKPALAPANWCTAGSASSTSANPRFTRTVGQGYTVEKSDLLPDVPKIGAVGALVGGPLFHIDGRFATNALVHSGGTLAGVNVDTAGLNREIVPPAPEPSLISAHYLLDAAAAVDPAVKTLRKMDYLGTATWSASESLAGTSCVVVDFMLGAGISLNNNPLPIGFGNLPIWGENPAAAGLIGSINAAVDSLLGQVTTNPTVAAILEQITGVIPPVAGVPEL